MALPGSRLVTVFGGSGFIGAQVVRALARDGWRVRVAVRNPNLAMDLRPQGEVGQIQLMACDVRNDAAVEAALAGVDAAVNLVGTLCETPWRRFSVLHVEAPERIARACAGADVQTFVHVSALGADAGAASAYARSKAEGEAAVRGALKSATMIRPSVVFGRGDSFLNRFAAMAAVAPALPLPGGGRTRFQPVHVGDVARAIARAANDPGAQARTYALGGPEIWSLREILAYVLEQTGRERALIDLPWPVASLVGALASPMALLNLDPPLTDDQVRLLRSDNVVPEGADGLAALGVEAVGLEAVAPAYLWRYRKGGQFADPARA